MAGKTRKRNTLTSDIVGFTKASVGLGVGAGVAAGASAGSGISVTPAFATMGSMMPVVGLGMMGGHALRGLRGLQPKKRKKRKR